MIGTTLAPVSVVVSTIIGSIPVGAILWSVYFCGLSSRYLSHIVLRRPAGEGTVTQMVFPTPYAAPQRQPNPITKALSLFRLILRPSTITKAKRLSNGLECCAGSIMNRSLQTIHMSFSRAGRPHRVIQSDSMISLAVARFVGSYVSMVLTIFSMLFASSSENSESFSLPIW